MSSVTPIISQRDYLEYKHALDDLKVVCRCWRKDQLGRLSVIGGRIVKAPLNTSKITVDITMWCKMIEQEDPLNLAEKIKIINGVHAKLIILKGKPVGEYPLAADLHHESLKVMNKWNQLWEVGGAVTKLCIELPAEIPKVGTVALSEDEIALKRYFELLQEHPELKRTGELNDCTKGALQILYEKEQIEEVRRLVYERLLTKTGSQAIAFQGSIVGVVFEDSYWVILRDAVISPQGYKHTYNRLIWKNQLNGTVGAAVMPLIEMPTGQIKVSLLLHFRHATQSFEFELPRGVSKPGETPDQVAIRELKEETGYDVEKPQYLGEFPPDSGMTSSLVSVFMGKVSAEVQSKQGKKEVIQGKYLFSVEEIKKALRSEDKCLEVFIDNERKRYPVRDPFLIYALCTSHESPDTSLCDSVESMFIQ